VRVAAEVEHAHRQESPARHLARRPAGTCRILADHERRAPCRSRARGCRADRPRASGRTRRRIRRPGGIQTGGRVPHHVVDAERSRRGGTPGAHEMIPIAIAVARERRRSIGGRPSSGRCGPSGNRARADADTPRERARENIHGRRRSATIQARVLVDAEGESPSSVRAPRPRSAAGRARTAGNKVIDGLAVAARNASTSGDTRSAITGLPADANHAPADRARRARRGAHQKRREVDEVSRRRRARQDTRARSDPRRVDLAVRGPCGQTAAHPARNVATGARLAAGGPASPFPSTAPHDDRDRDRVRCDPRCARAGLALARADRVSQARLDDALEYDSAARLTFSALSGDVACWVAAPGSEAGRMGISGIRTEECTFRLMRRIRVRIRRKNVRKRYPIVAA